MNRRIAAIALAPVLFACTGGSPGAPAPDAGLAYAMPASNPLAFIVTDTVTIDMDISGTPVQVAVRAAATMQADFSEAGDDALNVGIRYTDISGSFANSMGPAVPISNDDIPGTATVRVAPDGEVTVLELPESSEAFRQVFGTESAYQRLFLRLPDHAVLPGATWTDTVSIVEDIGGLTSESTQIIESTLVGDTVIDGRRLRVIGSAINGTTRVSGVNQGMEIRQYLNGSSSATTLWDPTLRTIVERHETGVAQGSMEMPGMGLTGLPVRMSSKAVIRLERAGT